MSGKETQVISKQSLKGYRACFVPLCGNNSKKNPDKVFVHVPMDAKKNNCGLILRDVVTLLPIHIIIVARII